MSTNSPFVLGKKYSFEIHPNAIMPTIITNARVTSVMSGLIAEKLGYQVATKHAQLYPSLPQDSSDRDYRSQLYILCEFDNGQSEVYGLDWIRLETVKQLSTANYVIELSDVSPEAASALRDVLNANGYQIRSIVQKDVSMS